MLFLLCVALLLLAVGLFSSFVLRIVLLSCLGNPVWHRDHLIGEKRAGYLVFLKGSVSGKGCGL